MHRKLISLLIIFIFFTRSSFSENGREDRGRSPPRDVKDLPGLPKNTEIIKIDALDYIKQNNRKHHMMGVSDKKCDNANYSLAVDFDPNNQTLLELNSKCFENQSYYVDPTIGPRLTVLIVPKKYTPIHRCMNHKIEYIERIPLIGPHRPLWAGYGEYQYLPPQRWLHNIEHGAIVLLYHPCADQQQLKPLKELVKSCLFRHVITPFANLTQERPIALVGWSASLEFARFDYEMAREFIKFYALSGPERMFRDGQYKHLIIERAKVVTNVIDSEICPNA